VAGAFLFQIVMLSKAQDLKMLHYAQHDKVVYPKYSFIRSKNDFSLFPG
jgi:hypothetical protein